MSAGTEPASIYDTIGGEPALVAVVDDFYRRVLDDPTLAGFFVGTNMGKLKGRQVEFFAQALGGPQVYQGPDMRQVHQGRGISQQDFDQVAAHLAASLTDAGAPADIVGTIISVVAPLASDIVSGG